MNVEEDIVGAFLMGELLSETKLLFMEMNRVQCRRILEKISFLKI